jgi:hypothetical protein
MTSIARAILDRVEAGLTVAAEDWESIPLAQWEIYEAELSAVCPSRITPYRVKQRNALRIEVLPSDGPRCIRKSPDGRGSAWLMSGGDPLSYGACDRNHCPRALAAAAPDGKERGE